MRPLGDYDEFRFLTDRAFPWGPGDKWRAWFAGGVLEGLAAVIEEHAGALGRGSGSLDPGPAVIGCVPWLTSGPILERLKDLGGCCVVIGKGASSAAARGLAASANGVPNSALAGLADTAPRDDRGDAVVVGPSSSMPSHTLGPLRVAGWLLKDGSPLLHAKLMVLGELAYAEDDFGRDDLHFFSKSLWWGSANWTKASSNHLEAGFWADDRALVQRATSFLEAVIRFSEPWDSVSTAPAPNLAEVEYDDEAMAEALAQSGVEE